jgi:hypothetical protein
MQVNVAAPSGMGVVGGVGLELTEEEKRYYVSAVETATVIVAEAMRKINGDERIPILITSSQESESEPEFVVELAKEVFGKIASPLFYLRSEKQQEARQEAKQMGKKEAAKGLAVEFIGNVLAPRNKVLKEWRVESETEKGKTYQVCGDPVKDLYTCDCPDFTYRGGGRRDASI